LGLGDAESFEGHGDSGGPLFLNGAIAGITSYDFGFLNSGPSRNLGFGCVGVATRLSIPGIWQWINGFIGPAIHPPTPQSISYSQGGQADGQADVLQLTTTATTVNFYFNGALVHSEWLGGLDSLTIQGTGDPTSYIIPSTLADRTQVVGGSGSNSLTLDD